MDIYSLDLMAFIHYSAPFSSFNRTKNQLNEAVPLSRAHHDVAEESVHENHDTTSGGMIANDRAVLPISEVISDTQLESLKAQLRAMESAFAMQERLLAANGQAAGNEN